MALDPAALTLEDVLAETGSIRALARRLLGDEQDAHDAIAHAAEQAVRAQPARGAGLLGFVRRVVRNRAADVHRRRAARSRAERSVMPPGAVPSAADIAEAIEARRLVAEAVLALPAPLREIVWLHYYEGQSLAAVAQRLEVPTATAKSRLQRALTLLRADLGRRAPDWRGAVVTLAGAMARPRTLRWPVLWTALAAAALVALVFATSTTRTPARDLAVLGDFDWLRRVSEMRVQVAAPDGTWQRQRYARVLPTSSHAPGDVRIAWDRDGTPGEDRFEFDAAAGVWRVRLASSATASDAVFVGTGAQFVAESGSAPRRLTLGRVAGHPRGEIAVRDETGAWRVVERTVFLSRP